MTQDAAATLPQRRIVLVHAHPDDETINDGALMARYAAEGVHVTLVTCTLGEMGEVLVPELGHLAYDRDGGLGQHRIHELAAAMSELGVTDARFLGGPGRFHDSGMAWSETGGATVAENVPDGAFWLADLLEAADLLVEVLREVRPQVLVTYDESGGYGHPDHVQAHRVATYAVALAGAPSYRPDLGAAWDVAKVYWTAMPESKLRDSIRRLREAGDTTTFEGMDPDGPLPPFAVPDEMLTAAVDSTAYVDRKLAAMRAHATQISVDGPFFALSNNEGNEAWGVEFYRLVKGTPGALDPATGLEADLFAGLP
ncbi:MAG: 1D-myo-inositol 2-acetamido-2-deoxy-alpha-D-glucopyranoside deacetylase [uncultured Nocardioidaceae bacterium]|uniref:1D-myo-inositol 2-acetamido-2-deoxy-alpha-D-glucopyranoside deacetylase n=1 Tax=uncultured Nocardioidaceae bacterium TaxID=253824 RepID=A0A6J4L8P7_9ACTN|nr:MAG: 1D-myo-inositol 2-acetamido-2-deoxy-alpha-D-glucopyranoside deacetylase [uncultured Nocardioidaceae bacterium]